jgi:hypothetical protein
VQPGLPIIGATRTWRGHDGPVPELVAPQRYVPLACQMDGEGGRAQTFAAPCVLDLDRLALAAGPVRGVELDFLGHGPDAAAFGDGLQVLPIEDTVARTDALAVFDTRTGRYTRAVTVAATAGGESASRIDDVTIGRAAVFGQAYVGGRAHVFAFDPVTGEVPWSEPAGLAARALPALLAKLPAAP